MDKNDIIEYVMNTPHNTNPAVLSSMLNQLDEGGGGSSDFSTATVTVINNTENSRLSLNIPTVCEANELGEGSPAMIYNYMACPLGESTQKVRLYKGLAYCDGVGSTPGITLTVSGNITIKNDAALITGDCTITIS